MNKKHFTLVEVLVVVGIISVLAGLLIPAVGMARQAGRRTECVSNQGQLMKLLTVTMQADDNYLVSGNQYGKPDDGDPYNPAWTRYLHIEKNRLTNLKGFRCPALPTNFDPDLRDVQDNGQYKSALGVVASKITEAGKKFCGFDFRGSKRLSVSTYTISPSQLVIGGCSGSQDSQKKLIPHASLLFPKKSKSHDGHFYVVHGDEFNMFFLDGHVESVTPEKAKKNFVPMSNSAKSTPITDVHIRNYDTFEEKDED